MTLANSSEDQPPISEELGASFTFADGSEEYINTLEEASSLLRLDELKIIAKQAKLQGKNKPELLNALRRTSQGQGGLEWSGFKISATECSMKSEPSKRLVDWTPSRPQGGKSNRDAHFLRKILDFTGPCIRLSSAALKLFERVHLVFYRSTEWTDKSLTTIILARIAKRNFPNYIVCRSTNIFPSRSALSEFEASIRTQFRIDDILEMSGAVNKEGLQKVKDIFEQVYPRWRNIIKEEQHKEDRIYETGEGAYLRRFSPAWVYTRVAHKGAYVLGRFKEHKREHQILTELLVQKLFHAARRGSWYQRKALLEEHYMWALEPDEGRCEIEQKKYWKRIALQTCEDALQDRDCHLIYHYDLQKRVLKLERSLKIAKRQQHDFRHLLLSKATERTVEGIRIEKEPMNGIQMRADLRRGRKTIWVDEREGGGECSVEAMCLSWYRGQGWKGYHSEGGIIRTLVILRLFGAFLSNGSLNAFSSVISSTTFSSRTYPMSFKPPTRHAPSTSTPTHSTLPEPLKSTIGSWKLPMATQIDSSKRSLIAKAKKKPVSWALTGLMRSMISSKLSDASEAKLWLQSAR